MVRKDLFYVAGDIWCGERHPRANTDFKGKHMCADEDTWYRLETEPDFTFKNAGSVGFCVVGDDITQLVDVVLDYY